MAAHKEFSTVFAELRMILKQYEPLLDVQVDKPGDYSLNAGYSPKWKKEIFFGATSIKKNYVSFYLMPVYTFPELLRGVSPEMKTRMQGKSCFNFKVVEPSLLREFARLTQRGIEKFEKEGLV